MNKDRVNELVESGITNQSEIARILCREEGRENFNAMRVQVQRYLGNKLTNECEQLGIDPATVDHYWYKGKHFSIHAKNPTEQVDFESIILEVLKLSPKKIKINPPEVNKFDRLIWTDVHVGMDASRKGLAMYAADWNAKTLIARVEEMARVMLENKKSDVLYIDELGDFMDGYNAETTRGGHKLPQNMTNEEAFDTGLKAKVMLVDMLAPHYKYIFCNNVNNDNHSGSWGYVVNSAFKNIVDIKHDNVSVYNHKKFLSYYTVGDHCFVLTHGKDDRNMKYGFRPQLDAKQIYKIDQYLKNEDIYRKAKYIEFSKGDSHQCLFDMCSSDDFHYFNYPAFSPSSEWVQINFAKGRSGFVMQNVDMFSSNKSIHTYFFN